jgi:hypothetical protein
MYLELCARAFVTSWLFALTFCPSDLLVLLSFTSFNLNSAVGFKKKIEYDDISV